MRGLAFALAVAGMVPLAGCGGGGGGPGTGGPRPRTFTTITAIADAVAGRDQTTVSGRATVTNAGTAPVAVSVRIYRVPADLLSVFRAQPNGELGRFAFAPLTSSRAMYDPGQTRQVEVPAIVDPYGRVGDGYVLALDPISDGGGGIFSVMDASVDFPASN